MIPVEITREVFVRSQVMTPDEESHELEDTVAAGGLSESDYQEIERRVRSILEEAPSDAHAEFVVRKSARGYKGLLKICSRQQKFVGGGIGLKARDVVNTAFDEVREQIRRWKQNRSFQAL